MDEFQSWLGNLHADFLKLSSERKKITLDFVISILDAEQLYHLSQILHCLLKRDFICQLPTELAHQLLSYLDADTLLTCCKVSQEWNGVISACLPVWRKACQDLGIVPFDSTPPTPEIPRDGESFKHLYERSKKTLDVLQKGNAFREQDLDGHSDRVMAVYYSNGLLATGSDDRCVRIWDTSSGECLKVFRVHTVADLKFDDTQILTASFDTTAACWDMDGNLKQHFQGHVAAIFSIDFSSDLDLVITGSADSTVKVWRLSSGAMLKTLTQYRSAWITQVCLYQWLESDASKCRHSSNVCTCDNNQHCDSTSTSDNNNEAPAVSRQCCILSRDHLSLHLWFVHTGEREVQITYSEEWNNSLDMALLPGLCRKKNSFLVAFYKEQTSTIHVYKCALGPQKVRRQTNGLPQQSLLSDMVEIHSCVLPHGAIPQYYLGSGLQWNAFILDRSPFTDLHFVHHQPRDLSFSHTLPRDLRPSKRGSTFSLCETAWLDGFKDVINDQPVFVTSLRTNQIHLLHWRIENG